MKTDALAVFVCPTCHGHLALRATAVASDEIAEGELRCVSCAATFPVRRGVPRFVPSGSYASSFGRQWNWFRTVQIDSCNRSAASAETFRLTTGWSRANLAGRTVLDAGVGAGRFAEVAADMGARVFGVDLTDAIDAAYANIGRRPGVHLAQADIMALPLRPESVDLAYSIGVLHHTPDTARAFTCVAATVKPHGQLAVYLYDRYGNWHRSSTAIRRVTTRLPAPVVLGLSAAAIPLHYLYKIPGVGSVLRLALPISPAREWRWRWLDTFDWYSPKYQWKFLYPEVFRWFRANGFHDVELFDGPIRMRGVKVSQSVQPNEQRAFDQLVAS